MPKKFALIVAGGSGSRMKNALPKQFLEIQGRPVLMHTFEAFLRFDSIIEFLLVLPKQEIEHWQQLCAKHRFVVPHQLAFGGQHRFQSVKNGLDKINDDGIVFIHDGVRPLVSKQTLQRCLETASQKGNALPVVPPSESIRWNDGQVNKAVDRSKYFLVQTPQTFRVKEIKAAYRQTYSEKFTDDASVLEATGKKIYPVPGNHENIKITFPEDLKIAEVFLSE